jgi:DNA processing protein
MDQTAYLNALNKLPGIGTKSLQRLLAFFETPENAWKADENGFQAAGIGAKKAAAMAAARKTISPAKEWETLESWSIQAVSFDDPAYPRLLKEIPDAPYVIYRRGAPDWNAVPLVTVVGSRRCSDYGERAARRLAGDLAAAGIGVVSGLAFGIDAAAHRGALEAGGYTVAVLGDSLDDPSIAPKEHLPLARSILAGRGTLVSEYPPVTPAGKGTFPARNRIMAGMASGTVVVEAGERSGTLITSRLALEFNRDVFAMPGSIFSEASRGPHRLLRAGAKPVGSVGDILEEIRPCSGTAPDKEPLDLSALSPEERSVVSVLSGEPVHIDKIAKLTTLDTSAAGATLAFLEMKGIVRNIGGMNYVKM